MSCRRCCSLNDSCGTRVYASPALGRTRTCDRPSLVLNYRGYMDWLHFKNCALVSLIHAIHWCLYLSNIFAIIPLILFQPWYIFMPLVTVLGHPIISGAFCGLNNLENHYREKAGWTIIQHNFTEVDMPYIIKFFGYLGVKQQDPNQ